MEKILFHIYGFIYRKSSNFRWISNCFTIASHSEKELKEMRTDFLIVKRSFKNGKDN